MKFVSLSVFFLFQMGIFGRYKRDLEKCKDFVTLAGCENAGEDFLNLSRTKVEQIVARFTTVCKYDSIKFNWAIKIQDAASTKILERTTKSNIFILEPFTLERNFYAIDVEVKLTRNGVEDKDEPLASCAFQVFALEPIPSIVGGSERVVEANRDFVIDGSISVDRDVPLGQPGDLLFKWSCEPPNQTGFCTGQTQKSIIKVPARFAKENFVFVFTLNVKNKDVDIFKYQWVSTKQTVRVGRDVTEFEIICEKNCPPLSTTTNPKHLTFLRVKCVRNCDDIEENLYQWDVDDPDFNYQVGTHFGKNTDRFIIKENVLNPGKTYKTSVSYSGRNGQASMFLVVMSPIKIKSCSTKPAKGKALETKFTIDCEYDGYGYIFEILAERDGERVILTKRNSIDNIEFILPSTTQVTIKITDVEGYDDSFKVEIDVESSQNPENFIPSISQMIENGDLASAIQLTHGIIEEVGANSTQIKKTLLEHFQNFPIKSKDDARHIATIITKLVYNPNATSDPYQGEIATTICKMASEVHLDFFQKEAYPTSLASEVQDITQTLMKCAETDVKENFEMLEPIPSGVLVTTPYSMLTIPFIQENYPDYEADFTVDEKRKKYDISSHNFIKICEVNLKMMLMTVVEGEDTLTIEGNTSSAHITRMIGKRLAGNEINTGKTQFKASVDLKNIDGEIDVTMCSWEKNPFWWNLDERVVNTAVLLVKVVSNNSEITQFEQPNRIHLDFSSEKIETYDVEVKANTILRIEVKKNEAFIVTFHLGVHESLKVMISHFDKPEDKKVEVDGELITKDKNIIFQKHNFTHDSWYYISVTPDDKKENFSYRVSIYTKGCYSWNTVSKQWEFACEGSMHPEPNQIHCTCHHLSILGGIFYNNIIKIDTTLETDLEMILLSSYIIFATTASIFGLYSLLIIIIHKTSNKILKVYIPCDISTTACYVYLVEITTGRNFSSGTSSNICIKLYGSLSSSESHVLNYPDPQKRILQRNNKDWFLIPTYQHLGSLEEIELWSDYSGRQPKWFCSEVVVYDLQINKKWHFRINTWFDLPPYGQIYLTSRVFEEKKKWRFRKIFFSCMPKRVYQKEFSAFRQLTLLLSIFLTIFAACLVLYGTPRMQLSDGFARSEIYNFDWWIIWVALASSVISFIIHMLLTGLFKYSKNSNVTWFILTSLIVTSLIFLIIFGFWVPQLIGWFWLTSAAVSVLVYFFILENSYGLVINFFWKDTISRFSSFKFGESIEKHRKYLFRNFGEDLLRQYFSHLYKPMDDREIKERRIRTETKRNLLILLEDTVMFAVYVTFLYLAVYAYLNKLTVLNYDEMIYLLKGNHTRSQGFEEVKSLNKISEYINKTLIPTIHAQQWYFKWVVEESALLADFNNKLLGVARIRQKRVHTQPCKMESLTGANLTCREEFWYAQQDFGSFKPENSIERLSHIWNFTYSASAGFSVCVGKFGVYQGGGFIAPLGRTMFNSYVNLLYLKNMSWLDTKTCVVMIEFLVYNVNSNLFSAVRIVFERSTTGYMRNHLDLNTSQFLFVKDEDTKIQMMIFISFFLIVLIFTLKFLSRVYRSKLLVLSDVWTVVDLLIVAMSYGCFGLFMLRSEAVGKFLDKVEKAKKNEFINYFSLLNKDTTFLLTAAFLIFVATVRLWKAFRFATIFRIMEKTVALSLPSMSVIFLTHTIFLVAYTFSGFMIFSRASNNFKDIRDSLFTLLLLLMGLDRHFDMESLISTNPDCAQAFYISYMLLSNVYLTIYVAVIIFSYGEARQALASSDDDFKKFQRFLFKEVSFHRTLVRMTYARITGGGRKSIRFVVAKPDELRYAHCVTLDAKILEFMRCVAIYDLKKFLMSDRDRIKLMKRVARNCLKKDNMHIFFTERSDNVVRVVHDYRIRRVAAAAEMIVNFDEGRKERAERRYKKIVEQQANKLNFIELGLNICLRIVSNIEIEE